MTHTHCFQYATRSSNYRMNRMANAMTRCECEEALFFNHVCVYFALVLLLLLCRMHYLPCHCFIWCCNYGIHSIATNDVNGMEMKLKAGTTSTSHVLPTHTCTRTHSLLTIYVCGLFFADSEWEEKGHLITYQMSCGQFSVHFDYFCK